MWTAFDMWSDDPEFDAERYSADPAYMGFDERCDYLQETRTVDDYECKEESLWMS